MPANIGANDSRKKQRATRRVPDTISVLVFERSRKLIF